VSNDFLTAAQEILAEYGEPFTVKNRSGTTTGTAVKAFVDGGMFSPDYWGESAVNADDDGPATFYITGDTTLGQGYSLLGSPGTYSVNHLASYKEGTTTALHVARCRKQ